MTERSKNTVGDVVEGRADYCVVAGDCGELLRDFPKRFDAIVTDPPFGIGFDYDEHDDRREGYGDWIWSRIEAAESLLLPGSPVFVWQSATNVREFPKWFPRDWRIFVAAKNFVQIRKNATMQYSYDPVLVWWTDGGDRYTKAGKNRDFHLADTTPSSRSIDGDVRWHPCPRPLEQMTHVLREWVRPGGVVLDPFSGSGTTGVAATRLGMRFVGVEKSPEYARRSEIRIEESKAGLFR